MLFEKTTIDKTGQKTITTYEADAKWLYKLGLRTKTKTEEHLLNGAKTTRTFLPNGKPATCEIRTGRTLVRNIYLPTHIKQTENYDQEERLHGEYSEDKNISKLMTRETKGFYNHGARVGEWFTDVVSYSVDVNSVKCTKQRELYAEYREDGVGYEIIFDTDGNLDTFKAISGAGSMIAHNYDFNCRPQPLEDNELYMSVYVPAVTFMQESHAQKLEVERQFGDLKIEAARKKYDANHQEIVAQNERIIQTINDFYQNVANTMPHQVQQHLFKNEGTKLD